jgi:hypothetical protein
MTEPQNWPAVCSGLQCKQSMELLPVPTPHEYELRADNLVTVELTLIHFLTHTKLSSERRIWSRYSARCR